MLTVACNAWCAVGTFLCCLVSVASTRLACLIAFLMALPMLPPYWCITDPGSIGYSLPDLNRIARISRLRGGAAEEYFDT